MVYLCENRPKSGCGNSWKKISGLAWALALLLCSESSFIWAADEDPVAEARVTKPMPPKTVARTYNGQLPPPEIKQAIDGFFTSLMKDDPSKAFDAYLKGTRLAARENSIHALVDNTEHAFVLYGKMTTFEPIDTYQIGSRLIITTYLTYLPVSPLRWRFVYYKADTAWQLFDMRVDDQISDIIEQ